MIEAGKKSDYDRLESILTDKKIDSNLCASGSGHTALNACIGSF